MSDQGQEMRDMVVEECHDKMAKAIVHLKDEFAAVRTGRASSSLVEKLKVDYYGTDVPLQQLAGFAVPEPRVLVISPYDKGAIKGIEKAIQTSDLGITPNNDGQIIRLQLPELTEERRRQLVKVVKGLTEDGKVALRNIRRDVMHDLKELKDAGEAGADDEHRAEEALQKLTNEKVAELDAALKAKEAEITEV